MYTVRVTAAVRVSGRSYGYGHRVLGFEQTSQTTPSYPTCKPDPNFNPNHSDDSSGLCLHARQYLGVQLVSGLESQPMKPNTAFAVSFMEFMETNKCNRDHDISRPSCRNRDEP